MEAHHQHSAPAGKHAWGHLGPFSPLTLQLSETLGVSPELGEWNQQRFCLASPQNHENHCFKTLNFGVVCYIANDSWYTPLNVFFALTVRVKMYVRPCYSSAQNTPMLYYLPQNKRVIFPHISCHSPLVHAYRPWACPACFLLRVSALAVSLFPEHFLHSYL